MINKVTLIGRLGKDPEVRHFDNSSVCNFTIATSESYTDKEGNRIEQTEWHNIAIWRKGLVDVAEKYLGKGQLVYIEGKLRTRNWEDQNGGKRYSTEVVVDNFKMLERKDASSSSSGNNMQQSNQSSSNTNSSQSNSPSETAGAISTSQKEDIQQDDDSDDLPF